MSATDVGSIARAERAGYGVVGRLLTCGGIGQAGLLVFCCLQQRAHHLCGALVEAVASGVLDQLLPVRFRAGRRAGSVPCCVYAR
jgi:hypothetical protein